MSLSLLGKIGIKDLNLVSFVANILTDNVWNVQVLNSRSSGINVKNGWDLLKKGNLSVKSLIWSAQDEGSWKDIGEFDSFISINGVKDSQIVENAIEQGSFRSVNKINKPRQFVVELAKGGELAIYENGIKNLIYNLDQYAGSTDICRIITPYGVINNLNLVKFDYSFTKDDGANLLIAKLTFKEVLSATVKTDNYTVKKVKIPANSNTVNAGNKSLEG